MLATAPTTRSVSYQRRNFNPRRPEKSQSRIRCAVRAACMADTSMSIEARMAYFWWDDFSRGGFCCAKQTTIAAKVGISRQDLQRNVIPVLIERGWLVPAGPRNGRANRYWLKWAAPHGLGPAADAGMESGHRHPICNPVHTEPECAPRTEPEQPAPVEASLTGTSEPEKTQDGAEAPERECPRCHGTHYLTVVEYFRVGRARHMREKRVLCRC